MIILSDFLFYHQEEGFISAGESEAIYLTEGDASGSSAVPEDAGETFLATEAEGVWDGDGSGGAPVYSA